MHLLLGNSRDSCCVEVSDVLTTRGYPNRIIANPLLPPTHFAWWVDNERSASQLGWDGEPLLRSDEITGVLVRDVGWLDPAGWQPDDLAYMQAEVQAGLLAWLWSLTCPIVNRLPAAVWYQPQAHLLSWRRLLRRSGLPAPQTLVTSVEPAARSFARQHAPAGLDGVVYGPLTCTVRYLVCSEEDWRGLAAMQRCAPVCLSAPHGSPQFACVVGRQVVWEGEPSPELARLEPALRRFATETGLAFVEVAFAAGSAGISVIAVEPQPDFEHFGHIARQQIVAGLVDLLTTEMEPAEVLPVLASERSFS